MVENTGPKMTKKWWATALSFVAAFGIAMPAAAAHGEGGISAQIQELRNFVEAQFGQNGAEHDSLSDQIAGLSAPDPLMVQAQAVPLFADPGESPVFPTDPVSGGFNFANILVRVTSEGEGVQGLTEDAFTLATRLVPAGQCALEIDEISSFGPPFGDYVLKVTPIDHPIGSPEETGLCHWEVGTYVSTIEVQWNGIMGSTLVGFDVS